MLPSLKQARVPFNASNTMYSLCSFGTSGEREVCWRKFAAVGSCRARRPRGRHHSSILRVRMLEAPGPRVREIVECRRWKTVGADMIRTNAPPRLRPGPGGEVGVTACVCRQERFPTRPRPSPGRCFCWGYNVGHVRDDRRGAGSAVWAFRSRSVRVVWTRGLDSRRIASLTGVWDGRFRLPLWILTFVRMTGGCGAVASRLSDAGMRTDRSGKLRCERPPAFGLGGGGGGVSGFGGFEQGEAGGAGA